MRATLYEALGIPQAASDEEVRAALRQASADLREVVAARAPAAAEVTTP